MTSDSPEIRELCRKIETAVGRGMHTPADFDFLSGEIYARTGEYISPTTLKRTWGYLAGVKTIRYSTLEILSRAGGYRSWENYLAERKLYLEPDSGFVSRGIVEAAALGVGDVVEVGWKPDRRCAFKYLGGERFEVVEAVNTHLLVGDTASVKAFIIGEPLILSDLNHLEKAGLTYLCGAGGGLTSLSAYTPSEACSAHLSL